jgi:hypothetical protein
MKVDGCHHRLDEYSYWLIEVGRRILRARDRIDGDTFGGILVRSFQIW